MNKKVSVLLMTLLVSFSSIAQMDIDKNNSVITKDDLNYFDVFAFVISNTHTDLRTGKSTPKIDINSEQVIGKYMKDCKGINLRDYDEFDIKKAYSRYKDSLKQQLNITDLTKSYTNVIFIETLGEYDFKSKLLRLGTNKDLSLINFGMPASNGFAECAVFFINVPEMERNIDVPLDENEAEYFVKKFRSNRDSILIMVEQFRLLGPVLDKNYRSFVTSKIEKATFYVCHYYTPPYSSYAEQARDEANQMRPGYKSRSKLIVDRPLFEIKWPEKTYSHLSLY